jgi:hypothetical protein
MTADLYPDVGVAGAARQSAGPRIVTAIGEEARGNPTLAVIRASAEHAEGLLTSDVSLLQHASAQLPDPWARACAVEDQGVLLAAAGRDRDAIRSLEEALREYDRLGRARAWRAPADGCASSGCGADTG